MHEHSLTVTSLIYYPYCNIDDERASVKGLFSQTLLGLSKWYTSGAFVAMAVRVSARLAEPVKILETSSTEMCFGPHVSATALVCELMRSQAQPFYA